MSLIRTSELEVYTDDELLKLIQKAAALLRKRESGLVETAADAEKVNNDTEKANDDNDAETFVNWKSGRHGRYGRRGGKFRRFQEYAAAAQAANANGETPEFPLPSPEDGFRGFRGGRFHHMRRGGPHCGPPHDVFGYEAFGYPPVPPMDFEGQPDATFAFGGGRFGGRGFGGRDFGGRGFGGRHGGRHGGRRGGHPYFGGFSPESFFKGGSYPGGPSAEEYEQFRQDFAKKMNFAKDQEDDDYEVVSDVSTGSSESEIN